MTIEQKVLELAYKTDASTTDCRFRLWQELDHNGFTALESEVDVIIAIVCDYIIAKTKEDELYKNNFLLEL